MRTVASRIRVVCGTIGLAVAVGQLAHAADFTLTTQSLVPDPKGYLSCKVTAKSATPIGIVAVIRSKSGANVTEFGTSFRVSPVASGDGLYYAEETAGSLSNRARYCEVTVTGAERDDVDVTLSRE